MTITQFETRIEHVAVTYHIQMIATKKKKKAFPFSEYLKFNVNANSKSKYSATGPFLTCTILP